jgi:hypothetical protein
MVLSPPSCEDDEAQVSMTRVAPSDVEEEEDMLLVRMVQVEEAAADNRTGGSPEALPSCRSRATKAWGLGSASSTRRTGSSRGRNIPFAAGRGALTWGGGRGRCAGGFAAAGVASACEGARGLILLLRGCRVSICWRGGRVCAGVSMACTRTPSLAVEACLFLVHSALARAGGRKQ